MGFRRRAERFAEFEALAQMVLEIAEVGFLHARRVAAEDHEAGRPHADLGGVEQTQRTLARSALGIPVLKHREEVNGADRLSIACRKPFATCRRPARTTVINLATRTNANTVSSSRFTLAA